MNFMNYYFIKVEHHAVSDPGKAGSRRKTANDFLLRRGSWHQKVEKRRQQRRKRKWPNLASAINYDLGINNLFRAHWRYPKSARTATGPKMATVAPSCDGMRRHHLHICKYSPMTPPRKCGGRSSPHFSCTYPLD